MSRGDRSLPSSCERKGKIITTVIVWLLMGAIVNVAVAWYASFCFRCDSGTPVVLETPSGWWTGDYGRTLAGTDGLSWVRPVVGDPRSETYASSGRYDKYVELATPVWSKLRRNTEIQAGGMVETVAGLPMRSLYMRYRNRHPESELLLVAADAPLERASRRGVLVLNEHRLPLIPVWPGFAINTLFYAATLWLLFAFLQRRRRRIKRGLCPACSPDRRER